IGSSDPLRAFTDFDGFHPAGFPARAQVRSESAASTNSATRAPATSIGTAPGPCDLFPRRRIIVRVAKLADIDVPEGLIASAREGTESACARLYTALAPSTFGLIRRLVGARAVAEDLFQDTMMTVYERLHDYRGEGPFGAWVRRIAVSKCLMYLRSPWHRARIEIAGSGERLGLGPDDRGEHGSGFGGRYRSGYGGGHEPGELPGPVA